MTGSKQSHLGRNIAVVVGVIIVVGIGLLALYPTLVRGAPSIAYPIVSVSGTVKTVGPGTTPISVTFSSAAGNSTVAVASDGSYSLTLSNGQSFQIKVRYSSLGGLLGGTCSGGTLSLNVNSASEVYNITC